MHLIRKNPCILLLAAVFIYILFLLCSPDQVWMHPEELRTKSFILEQGTSLKLSDLKQGFNWPIFEVAPRLTRPWSSYFEIIDTKFRHFLWHFIAPHPSLSLTWVFSLILSPILLFYLLKNLNVNTNVALGAVSVYLMSPGLLSVVAMLFRPAKAMTNFAIILCLYLASCLQKEFATDESKKFLRKYLWLLGIIFINFFWDETALLIYVLVPAFFPFLLKDKQRLAIYCLMPALVYLCYFCLFPWLTLATGNTSVTSRYEYFPTLGHYSWSALVHFFSAFFMNVRVFILDSLGLIKPTGNSFWEIKMVMGIDAFMVLVAVGYIGRAIQRRRLQVLSGPIWGAAILLIGFHTYLMVETHLMVWGVFWYGIYWSVFFAICLALVLSKIDIRPVIVMIGLGILCLSLGVSFRATNALYKKFHYEPYWPSRLASYFEGHANRLDADTMDSTPGNQIATNLKAFKLHKSESLIAQNFWAGIEIEPRLYAKMGETYYERSIVNNYALGLKYFNSILKTHPNDFDALSYIGMVAIHLGDLDIGIPYLTKAIRIHDDDANLYFNRGLGYVELQPANVKNIVQALVDFDKAIALNPNYEEAYSNRGLINDNQHNYPQALRDDNQALRINPNDAVTYNNRAIVYFHLRDYIKSRQDVYKAEALGFHVNPKLVEALNRN